MTGATGVLGINLVEQLFAAGWDVTALLRPTSQRRWLSRFPVTEVIGTVEDADSVLKAMPEGVDDVFHMAADVSFWSGHRERQNRTNIDGTRNVVSAALQRGAGRFIHTSSMGVYGLRSAPFDESAEKLGRTSWINYFRTKTLAEEIVLEAIPKGLNAVILNPSNIVGRYDQHNWGRMFQLGQAGKLIGAPRGLASFCHATDVAKAHIAAVDRGQIGRNYLLGGSEATYLDCFRLVAELIGRTKVPMKVSKPLFRTIGRVSQWASYLTGKPPSVTPEIAAMFGGDQVIHSQRAVVELGYKPMDVRTMFEDCYRWLVKEGLLAIR